MCVDLNLIDWSFSNILAVALGTSVYLWNADTGAIDQLLDLEGANYVTSLSWIPNGNLLSVGTALGPVQVCRKSAILCVFGYGINKIIIVYLVMGCSTNKKAAYNE